MKTKEKEEAVRLRSLGFSYREILKEVDVSRSTLSIWLRGIVLSDKAKDRLTLATDEKRVRSAETKKLFHLNQRKKWQENGRNLARQNKNDPVFVSGCMLYWGEGYKRSRDVIGLTNSDPKLIIVFLLFLEKYLPYIFKNIKCSLNCYTDINSYEEIENYWSKELNIDRDRFNKPQINNTPVSSNKKRKNLSPYGTCCVRICSVEHKQMLFGAIQELGRFSRDDWLK